MNKDQLLGLLILLGSSGGVLLYAWLLFFSQWAILALQLTCFIVIVLVLGICAWIGYTFASASPPKPIEEVEKGIRGNESTNQ